MEVDNYIIGSPVIQYYLRIPIKPTLNPKILLLHQCKVAEQHTAIKIAINK
jgi:hypothetical protein